MADKHPREMTPSELRALASVNRVRKVVWRFEENGVRWAVGRSGSVWVKAFAGRDESKAPGAAA